MQYGLIGHPLGHSFSGQLHRSMGGYEYTLADIDHAQMERLLTEKSFCAINVTIPYKQAVIPFLDTVDQTAQKIGAVNTIVNTNGVLTGYNTDFFGLMSLAQRHIQSFEGMSVLILGGGGTSKTAACVAKQMGAARIIKAVRKIPVQKEKEIKYINLEGLSCGETCADILINTTPVGMFPNIYDRPQDISAIQGLRLVLDAVYNPLRTRLVSDAQNAGIAAEGGLYMLTAQAAAAVKLFCKKEISTDEIKRQFEALYKGRQNIVLIGMPGCGKSTVGKKAAELLGREFVDSDQIISEKFGNVPDIIRQKGEEYFRTLETQVIEQLSARTGLVIATGGGAVLRQKNRELLALNGKILFIDRPIEKIAPTLDRPLSSDRQAINELYLKRYPIYKQCAHAIIDANGTIEQVTQKVTAEAF